MRRCREHALRAHEQGRLVKIGQDRGYLERAEGRVVVEQGSDHGLLIVHGIAQMGPRSFFVGLTLAFSCGARSASKRNEGSYSRSMLSRRQLQGFVRQRLQYNHSCWKSGLSAAQQLIGIRSDSWFSMPT